MQLVGYIGFVFVLYSFLGWCLEEVYCFFITKHFKEDGFLKGPFKPMYGFAISIIVLIKEVLNVQGILLVITFFVVPTFIEYISGYLLKKEFNVVYWDYSENKFNYNGFICIKFSIYWTILTVGVVWLIQPYVMSVYNEFSNILEIITLMVLVYLLLDLRATIKLHLRETPLINNFTSNIEKNR